VQITGMASAYQKVPDSIGVVHDVLRDLRQRLDGRIAKRPGYSHQLVYAAQNSLVIATGSSLVDRPIITN